MNKVIKTLGICTGVFTFLSAVTCGFVLSDFTLDHASNQQEVLPQKTITITDVTFSDDNPYVPTRFNFSSSGTNSSLTLVTTYLYDEFTDFYVTGLSVRWTGITICNLTFSSGILFSKDSTGLSNYDIDYTLSQINNFYVTWRVSCTSSSGSYIWTFIPIFYYNLVSDTSNTFNEVTLTDIQQSYTSTYGTTYSGVMVNTGSVSASYLFYLLNYASNWDDEIYDNGYSAGLSDGTSAGYSDGYGVGYNAGLNAQGVNANFLSLFGAIADTPVYIIRSLFSFDIFGTTALTIFMSLLTVIIVVHFVRKYL